MGDRARVIILGSDMAGFVYETRIYTHNYGTDMPGMLQLALDGAMIDDAEAVVPNLAQYLVDYANCKYEDSNVYHDARYPAWRVEPMAEDENHSPIVVVLGNMLEDTIVFYGSRGQRWATLAEFISMPDVKLAGFTSEVR